MKKATPVQINWKPDKNNPVPLYQQIVDYIYQKISSGDWPVRTRLPSQRALAEQFDVNRSTITSALDELTAFGIIRSGHGAGTLVINNTWGLMLPEFQKWEKYVTSGSFMENNQTIQTINRMEFEENIIRLGTGELDPRIFPKDKWNQVLKDPVAWISRTVGPAGTAGSFSAAPGVLWHTYVTLQYFSNIRGAAGITVNISSAAKTRIYGIYRSTKLYEVSAGISVGRYAPFRGSDG